MRRPTLLVGLALLLTLSLSIPTLAWPQATGSAECTMWIRITDCPAAVDPGAEIAVYWELAGSGFGPSGHHNLHWDWVAVDGTRHPCSEANHPTTVGIHQETWTAPAANGYIELYVHASTGACSAESRRHWIKVGDPPPRQFPVYLPCLGQQSGYLFVTPAAVTNATGLATLRIPRGNVQVVATNQATSQPLADVSLVAAAADDRVMIVANDPAMRCVPAFVERAVPAGGSDPVLSVSLGMNPLVPGLAVYPAVAERPQLLGRFHEGGGCLTTGQLAALARPGAAVYVMGPAIGPLSQFVAGVPGADLPAAVRTLWGNLGAPDPCRVRFWTHAGVPLTFVEYGGACTP